MNKSTLNRHPLKANDLFSMVTVLTVLSFVVSWGIETFAMTVFSAGW